MAFKWRGQIMEFLGIFAINYIGGWSNVMKDYQKGDLVSVAIAHLFVIAILTWCGAAISGSHFNPAITISLLMTGNCIILEGCLFILMQIVGSFLSGIALYYAIPDLYTMSSENVNAPIQGYPFTPYVPLSNDYVRSFFLELIGSFVLVFVYFALLVDKRAAKHIYGIAIGSVYGISIQAFGPISGAALNPVRQLGPSLMEYALHKTAKTTYVSQIWIYSIAPIIGGMMAASVYNWGLLVKKSLERNQVKEVEFD